VHNQGNLIRALEADVGAMPPYPAVHLSPGPSLQAVLEQSRKCRRVVIHLGAKKRFRDWGITKFRSLIDRLCSAGITVYMVGHSEYERERGAELSARYPVTNLCGRLTVPDLYCLVDLSHLYIGADSGPLHVASLTDTPIIALYGPNLPEVSGPYRKRAVTIFQKSLACRPCAQKKSCIYDRIKCMEQITVEDVYEKSLEYLH
jgi:ADP-heptose:LPS heptosyltransferase